MIESASAPEPGAIPDEDRAFIGAVWDAYKQHSASALVSMTHEEAPWKNARHGLEPEEAGEREITHEALLTWFGPQVKELLIPSLPLAQTYKAVAEIDKHPRVRHHEVFASLRKGLQRDASR